MKKVVKHRETLNPLEWTREREREREREKERRKRKKLVLFYKVLQ